MQTLATQRKRTKKPFMLARVALKAYAVVLTLMLLLGSYALLRSREPMPIEVYALALILVTMIVGLFLVSRGLAKAKVWAQIAACVAFVGLAVLTVPILKSSVERENLPEVLWPQIWTVIMLCLGITSLLAQRPHREPPEQPHRE